MGYRPNGSESGAFCSPGNELKDQYYWHVWKMPAGMHPDDAAEFFKKKFCPRGYEFEKFVYNPKTGLARTL